MASPKIEYMLELSHENGNALADEDYARLTSNSPLPVPSVGDLVKLPGIQAKVMSRIFGPVMDFVSAGQKSVVDGLGHSVFEQDGEVVEGLLPVVDRHGPFAGSLANCHVHVL